MRLAGARQAAQPWPTAWRKGSQHTMSRSVLLWREDGSTQPFELTLMTLEVRANGVAVACFASGETFHALSPQMRVEMFLVLEHCKRSPAVKVVVWTATGDKAFCSGVSLKGSRDVTVDGAVLEEYARRGMAPNMVNDSAFVRETKAFWDFPKPIIGAVNGMSVGGGANIALAGYFDMVICSTNARFQYPFVDIGFTPELGSSLYLPLVIGPLRAKQVFYSGDWFSAQDALAWGACNEVVAPDQLLPRALAVADKLATKATPQLMLSKKLLNHHMRSFLDDQLRLENETIQASVNDHGGKDLFLSKIKAQAKAKKASL